MNPMLLAETAAPSMIDSMKTALIGLLGFFTPVFSWITSETVLPYFMIGIAASGILFAVKGIRSVVWGA